MVSSYAREFASDSARQIQWPAVQHSLQTDLSSMSQGHYTKKKKKQKGHNYSLSGHADQWYCAPGFALIPQSDHSDAIGTA